MTEDERKLLKSSVDSIVALWQDMDVSKENVKDIAEQTEEKLQNTGVNKHQVIQLARLVRNQNLNDMKTKVTDLEILYDQMLGLK